MISNAGPIPLIAAVGRGLAVGQAHAGSMPPLRQTLPLVTCEAALHEAAPVSLATAVMAAATGSKVFWRRRRHRKAAALSHRLADDVPAPGSQADDAIWERCSSEDVSLRDGLATLGFTQICLVDPMKLLGPDWDTFLSFVQLELTQTAALVRRGKGPLLLLQRVGDGFRNWPILQEGKH